MDLLVLGGTRFVGRALVADALGRGWSVTVLNRGTGPQPDGVRHLRADRTDTASLEAALAGRHWDAVADTWSGAPAVATTTAELLRPRAPRYGYVSSRSVYVWGEPGAESAPVVDADPWAGQTDYAADKRGAELVWVDEERLAVAGVEPWTQLPCWVPEGGEYAGFLESDTSLAARSGLRCRPVEETVADTWAWLQAEGPAPQRDDRPVHGLPPGLEQRLLG